MRRRRDGAQRRAAVVVETLLCPLPSPQSGEGAGGSYCLVHPPFRFTDSGDTAGCEKQPKKGEKMSGRAVNVRGKPRSDVWAFQTRARLFPALPPLIRYMSPHLLQSGSADARLYLSSQIKEALRVSSLASSAFDLPVFPLVKSFYSSTNTFLSQVRTHSHREQEERKWIQAQRRLSLHHSFT